MPINHKKVYALEETSKRCGMTVIDGFSSHLPELSLRGRDPQYKKYSVRGTGRKMLWHTEMCQPSQATVDYSPTQGCTVLALKVFAL